MRAHTIRSLRLGDERVTQVHCVLPEHVHGLVLAMAVETSYVDMLAKTMRGNSPDFRLDDTASQPLSSPRCRL